MNTKNDCYKHIIWIEDFDNNDPSKKNIPDDIAGFDAEDSDDKHEADISDKFGDYANQVHLEMRMLDMLDYIDSNLGECDCVVLDIKLNNGFSNPSDKESCWERLESKGVIERAKETKEEVDELKEYGGYYLYLYLLKCGFPADNICMFTGNKGDENSTGKWEKTFKSAGLKPPKSIAKDDKEELQKWIGEIYNKEYYKIRLLVYSACEFWKNYLSSTNNSNIAFNQMYYNGKDDNPIEIKSFQDMLDRVEMLFPIVASSNYRRIYYQVLQVVSMFHEESACIDKVKGASQKYKYHQAVRYFRNWSAHNKFSSGEIDGELFAYIFCTALRTYFENGASQNSVSGVPGGDDFKDYEKQYFKNSMGSGTPNFDNFQKNYRDVLNKHLCRVMANINNSNKKNSNNSNKKNNNNNKGKYSGISYLLYESGMCKSSGSNSMLFSDILLNILEDEWFTPTPQSKPQSIPISQSGPNYQRNQNGIESYQLTYTCQYDWKVVSDMSAWWQKKNCGEFEEYAYYLWMKYYGK